MASLLDLLLGTPALPTAGPPAPGSSGTPTIPATPGILGDLAGLGGSSLILAMLYDIYQRSQDVFQQQQAASTFAQDPNSLLGRINALTIPLQNQLIQQTMSDVAPGLAQAGLATSPGMAQNIMGQALAPYQMQQQQRAVDLTQFGLKMPFNIGSGLAGFVPSYLAASGFGQGIGTGVSNLGDLLSNVSKLFS